MRSPIIALGAACFAALCACGAARPEVATAVGDALELHRCEPAEHAYVPWLELDDCFEGELRAIAEVVDQAARYSLSTDAYAGLFTAGSEGATFGRRAEAEPFDFTLAPRVVGARNAFFAQEFEADQMQVVFGAFEIERQGDRARVEARRLELVGSGEDQVFTGIYGELVLVGGTWKIESLRLWPEGYATIDEGASYDEASWAALDDAVLVARARLAREPSADARGELAQALLSAMRYAEAQEALAPLLADHPDVDAIEALAQVHAVYGRVDEYRATWARRGGASPRPLASHMRQSWCSEARIPEQDEEPDADADNPESESYVDPDRRCDFEVIADLRVDRGELQGFGVVRTLHGFEASEAVHLMQHFAGAWTRVLRISDGPFIGNQMSGVSAITVSDVALRERPTGASPQLEARFERKLIDDGDEVTERGVLVCSFDEDAQCAFLPEHVVFDDGEHNHVTEYELTFTDDAVRIRRTSGPEQPGTREGRFELDSFFVPAAANRGGR